MFFDQAQQDLDRRCADLQSRSAALRLALAQDAQVLRAPLALADRLRQGGRWLLGHPHWLGAGLALLVVWRPRRAGRLGLRLWGAWRLWGRLKLLPGLAGASGLAFRRRSAPRPGRP